LIVVTPGIRPSWSVKGDQSRVMTPQKALALGADYLVIGRPITAAKDPLESADRVLDEISGA
jgi:orotidine-5'-phosphate decarboxylase